MSSSELMHTQFLSSLFDAALDVAQPNKCIPRHLPTKTSGKTIVIGAGKASAAMAKALEESWDGPLTGTVVTRYGYAVKCDHIKILEAAHPVPDENGLNAAYAILDEVSGLSEEDQVIVLISGGGSALMPCPVDGVSLKEKQEINQALLKCGANIVEMNTVRRHLSKIKGGQLAAACFPAKVMTLLISDVPGDDLPSIASGPTVGDTTTCADALTIIDKYSIPISDTVRANLQAGNYETIKPDDPILKNCENHLIATPQMALEAAAKRAKNLGIKSLILGDSIEGEAREVGKVMAGIAKQVRTFKQPIEPPCVLLSGGETTVTIKGNGVGGRNVEYLLSLAIQLAGEKGISAIACDTDGVDGAAELAGALMTDKTLELAEQKSIKPSDYLDNNDAHTFFSKLGISIDTGPTLTNVNDFRAIFIDK
ncbi:glycerate kinase type-2 family protein [Marinomonas mediterranea]|jgi:glycerate 2-kinase (EC 2.7.1.-)|uniref:Hydroxypyruvate reductase n=1 Tax=Marinomonas mediterranea (strain ATCC 700492 / JCM 21426 / NBRC 103028 / MMB-1) TaxID=717774 RepID=F2JZY0_MARM1|nr:glycerate kinase [Marinomonas mediterranea]ADZ92092.1 Hydroxypyruvate reductase [Marinomonas mediterranea MMB-1]